MGIMVHSHMKPSRIRQRHALLMATRSDFWDINSIFSMICRGKDCYSSLSSFSEEVVVVASCKLLMMVEKFL